MKWKLTNRNDVLVYLNNVWVRVGALVLNEAKTYVFKPAAGYEGFDPSWLSPSKAA